MPCLARPCQARHAAPRQACRATSRRAAPRHATPPHATPCRPHATPCRASPRRAARGLQRRDQGRDGLPRGRGPQGRRRRPGSLQVDGSALPAAPRGVSPADSLGGCLSEDTWGNPLGNTLGDPFWETPPGRLNARPPTRRSRLGHGPWTSLRGLLVGLREVFGPENGTTVDFRTLLFLSAGFEGGMSDFWASGPIKQGHGGMSPGCDCTAGRDRLPALRQICARKSASLEGWRLFCKSWRNESVGQWPRNG